MLWNSSSGLADSVGCVYFFRLIHLAEDFLCMGFESCQAGWLFLWQATFFHFFHFLLATLLHFRNFGGLWGFGHLGWFRWFWRFCGFFPGWFVSSWSGHMRWRYGFFWFWRGWRGFLCWRLGVAQLTLYGFSCILDDKRHHSQAV